MIRDCIVNAKHALPTLAFVKKGVNIYICPTCGCIMADLQFVAEQYEQDAYYTIASKDRTEVEQEWGFRWRYVLNRVKSRTHQPRILDVGAGNGYFVFLARKEFGFHADGLEISDAEIKYAREQLGVEILKGAIDDLAPQHYNAVGSFNVIEHVTDPTGLLAGIRRRLAEGGHLFITTPNPSCIHRRLSGLAEWQMVDPPHHINLFPRGALNEILTQAGFEVQYYATLSTYVRFVRKIDTKRQLLRKTLFHALKFVNLAPIISIFVAKRLIQAYRLRCERVWSGGRGRVEQAARGALISQRSGGRSKPPILFANAEIQS